MTMCAFLNRNPHTLWCARLRPCRSVPNNRGMKNKSLITGSNNTRRLRPAKHPVPQSGRSSLRNGRSHNLSVRSLRSANRTNRHGRVPRLNFHPECNRTVRANRPVQLNESQIPLATSPPIQPAKTQWIAEPLFQNPWYPLQGSFRVCIQSSAHWQKMRRSRTPPRAAEKPCPWD
jgi:hypothetical protein